MNIRQIQAVVNNNFLRGNRFKVMTGLGNFVDERCCSVSWPNITYSTFNWKNAGPNIKVPYEPVFDEVRLEFYCDHNGVVPSAIRKWNRDILDGSLQFNYFSEYVRDVSIMEYNTSNQMVHKKILCNAYPITIEPVQLGFELNNQVEKIAMLLSYEYSKDEG
jgi:hypothetical protein